MDPLILSNTQQLEDLAATIRNGGCVAFVGAGFSGPVVPGWKDLLGDLAETALERGVITADRHGSLTGMLDGTPSPVEYETVAQLLADALGDEFKTTVKKRATVSASDNPQMVRRLRALQRIPFRAVLTTNFDNVLDGSEPRPETFAEVLRHRPDRWTKGRFWDFDGELRGATTVKLHGDVEDPNFDLVLTRRDYRRRLYQTPGYLTFLRSVFSTSTVLYLGFSFTDAYFNELRSEVLALLGDEPEKYSPPLAFAVLADFEDAKAEYFRSHESVEVLAYRNGKEDKYRGFDAYLDEIADRTGAASHLRRALEGKTVVWMDPNPSNNSYATELLETTSGVKTLEQCDKPETALDLIERLQPDLVISHWGHGQGTYGGSTVPAGEQLLREIRARSLLAPVLLFAGAGSHAEQNRRRALGLGAYEYTVTFERLFEEITNLLID